MTTFKNPWEVFDSDCSQKAIEPADLCNIIKPTEFPFLKCNSTLEYLIKCKLCNVMLLPESISLHYENRHSNICADKSRVSVILPYEAVSWCEDNADTCVKKDRPIKRSKVLPLKRPKRMNSVDSDLLSFQPEKKSNGRQPDNTRKSIVHSDRDYIEGMREPVLLKLAKSDTKPPLHHEPPKLYAKIDEPKSIERSVWSVVYAKEQSRFDVLNTVSKRASLSETKSTTKDKIFEVTSSCAYSNDPSITSQDLLHHTSSYPPTPSLSPHVPSPNMFNTSDDITMMNSTQFRSELSGRPKSCSSTHSSSSSGIGLNDHVNCNEKNVQFIVSNPTSVYHMPSTCFAGHTQLYSKQSYSAGKCNTIPTIMPVPNKPLCVTPHDSFLSSGKQSDIPFDNEIEAAVFHLENESQNMKCDNTVLSGNKGRINKNGFHSWLSDVPLLTSNKDAGKRLLTLQRSVGISDSPLYATQQNVGSKQRKNVQAFPLQKFTSDPLNLNEHTRFANSSLSTPNVVELSKCGVYDCDDFPHGEWNTPFYAMDANLPQTDEDALNEDIDDHFDPNTQCGCVEIDDIKCKNSILCTVHKIEEKRLVPRPRDLRFLMREARQRQQISRQVPNVSHQRQIPWNIHTHSLSPAIIDLTGESNVDDNFSDSFSYPSSVTGVRRSNLRPQILRRTNMYQPTDIHISTHSTTKIMDSRYMTSAHYSADLNPPTENFHSTKHNLNIDNNQAYFNQLRPRLMSSETYSHDQEFDCNTIGCQSKYSPTFALPSYSHPRVIGDRSQNLFPQTHYQSPSTSLNTRDCTNRSSTKHSIDSTINLESLISQEDVFGTDELLAMEGSYSTNFTRKTSVPVVEQLSPSVGTTNLYSHMPYQQKAVQDSQSSETLDGTESSNRYLRGNLYGTNQVVREPQGRVIVDDMREKSITGRSRKTARTIYRPSGSNFQSPNFTNYLQFTNYRHPQHPVPSTSGYPGNRKSSATSTVTIGSTLLKKPVAFPPVELCNPKPSASPVLETSDSVDACYPPNEYMTCSPTTFLTSMNSNSASDLSADSAMSLSMDSNVRVNTCHLQDKSGNSKSHSNEFPNPNSYDSQTRVIPQSVVASSIPTLSIHSNNIRNPNYALQYQNSNLVNQSSHHGRTYLAQSIANSTDTTNTVLPSGSRYLVIRPSAIKQSTNLLLRTRRGENVPNCSANRSSIDET